MLKINGGTEYRSSPRRLEKLSINTDKHQNRHETRLFLILTTAIKKVRQKKEKLNFLDLSEGYSRKERWMF